MNLFTTFRPRLSEEKDFSFLTMYRRRNFNFSEDFSISKAPFARQIDISGTRLR